jgi:mono/diheme cytochrome c family protein
MDHFPPAPTIALFYTDSYVACHSAYRVQLLFNTFQGGTMSIKIKFLNRTVLRAAAMILGTAATAAVADDRLVDVGKSEYDATCAVCHGSKGKGNGPFVEQLANRVPDLTVLARSNKGVFPFDHVYQVIDGRAGVEGPWSTGHADLGASIQHAIFAILPEHATRGQGIGST